MKQLINKKENMTSVDRTLMHEKLDDLSQDTSMRTENAGNSSLL